MRRSGAQEAALHGARSWSERTTPRGYNDTTQAISSLYLHDVPPRGVVVVFPPGPSFSTWQPETTGDRPRATRRGERWPLLCCVSRGGIFPMLFEGINTQRKDAEESRTFRGMLGPFPQESGHPGTLSRSLSLPPSRQHADP